MDEISSLKAKIEEQKSIIAQLHQMTQNSINQELDGYKAKVAYFLKSAYKDFQDDYKPEEQAEVYRAILEDTFSALNMLGIKFDD